MNWVKVLTSLFLSFFQKNLEHNRETHKIQVYFFSPKNIILSLSPSSIPNFVHISKKTDSAVMAARFGPKMGCGGGRSVASQWQFKKQRKSSHTHTCRASTFFKKSLFGTLNAYAHNNHAQSLLFSFHEQRIHIYYIHTYILQGINITFLSI